MSRHDKIELEAEVIEFLPNSMCRVEAPNGHRVLARISNEISTNRIGILPGDKVMLQVSPYDLSNGRIVSRRQ